MTRSPSRRCLHLTEEQAAQAVERFIEAWNARDPAAFAEAARSTEHILNFLRHQPHPTTRS